MIDWYKNNHIQSARYPGGTPAAIWNWEWPSGKMDTWFLDPNKKPIWNKAKGISSDQEDPAEWMSMEEYMDFVNKTDIKPLIGVNYKCGIKGNEEEWPHCQLDDRSGNQLTTTGISTVCF